MQVGGNISFACKLNVDLVAQFLNDIDYPCLTAGLCSFGKPARIGVAKDLRDKFRNLLRLSLFLLCFFSLNFRSSLRFESKFRLGAGLTCLPERYRDSHY